MYKFTANPILIRLAVWLMAAAVALLALLFWGGGFDQLLESVNDLF